MLTAERARAWWRCLSIVMVAVMVWYVATLHHGMDVSGKPLGTDFLSFWCASHLALSGHPAAAYDPAIQNALERAMFPDARSGYVPFFYPPPFLLLCLPLATLPYVPALLVWLAATFLALYAALRRLLTASWMLLPALTFPAVLVNLGYGQNGFLTAACFALSMLLADEQPFLSGLVLGVLVIKPQLLLAAPMVLLAARRWKTIAGACTGALALGLASWWVLGTATWLAFLHATALARETMQDGWLDPWKMQSVFAGVRLLGGSIGASYLVQGIVALGTILLIIRCAAKRPGRSVEIVLITTAMPLCTPYLLDYDLTCLAVPLAWIAAQAHRTGWYRGEKPLLIAAYVLPLMAPPIAMATALPLTPLVMAGLLWIVIRRMAARDKQSWSLDLPGMQLEPAAVRPAGEGEPARMASPAPPHGAAVAPAGAVYNGDSENDRVGTLTHGG